MKVLMFGWEFPPHISGGLGTACHGLTHSLYDEGVKVLFVVPRLFGDEKNKNVTLINASSVNLPIEKNTSRSISTQIIESSIVQEGREFTTIEVSSALQPYQLSQHYHESSILNWNYTLPKSEKSVSEKTEETETKTTHTFSGGYGPDLLKEVDQYAEVAIQVAQQNSFDVIHAHDWSTFPAGIAAKQISGKPLVVHIHATEFDRAGENVNKRVFNIEYAGLQQADRIIAVSQWTRDILVKRYNVAAEKVEVVHNGIVPKTKAGIPVKNLLGSHIVTFIGRVTYQKGPLYFVDAAKRVLKEFPEVRFVVAGSGDLLPQMIERVAQLKMSAHFHFTGFLKKDDIDKLWSLSNVYVMPSVSEPFGITPLEAIQNGVPVIVSRQSGVAEVMPHAIKIDFWNTHSLAGAICSVLRYGSLATALTQNGREEVKQMTWGKAARKINKLYHEVTTTN
jgi:glycogen synthase